MAKKHYDMAMKEERALLGGMVSRWSDFRIAPNWTAGATQELSPLGLDKDSLNLSLIDTTGAEYNYSQIRDRDGNDIQMVLAGNTNPAAGRISVFDEYDAAGNVSQSPVASTAAMPYEELYAHGVNSDENADFLQTEGDLPPYRPTRHDEVWTKAGELISSIGGTQQLSTGVFAAPLGIVYLRGYQITTTGGVHDEGLTLEVLPGDYKGVMALDI